MSASPQPTAAVAACGSQGQCYLLQLNDASLTSHLLSFVPNHTFYVVLPQLCTVTRRLLAQSHLHKQHAQQRLSLSAELWREMRRREWQLAADDWDSDDRDNWDEHELQRNSGEEEKKGGGEGDGMNQHVEDVASTVEVQRDWSVVCTELHRRLSRLEQLIFRHAPLNCYGNRYQLPDAFRALLMDAWTVRLLAPHMPLKLQKRGSWRAKWVLEPSDAVEELRSVDNSEFVVSASEVRHLPIFLSFRQRGDGCWANPRQFVSIDCRPRSADGRQPANVNDALIVGWLFDPDLCVASVPYSLWHSSRHFLSQGGTHTLHYGGRAASRQRAVERLLLPTSGAQTNEAAEQWSDVTSMELGQAMEAARNYLLAPWLRRVRGR